MFNLAFNILCVIIIIVVILTIRAIVPRYKTDVLINIIWKIALPFFLIDILIILTFLI